MASGDSRIIDLLNIPLSELGGPPPHSDPPQVDSGAAVPIGGAYGQSWQEMITVPGNTFYQTAQVRNILFSTAEPAENSVGNNGDIWITYIP